MGNNSSRPSADYQSRPRYLQDRTLSRKGGWSTRRRRTEYEEGDESYDEGPGGAYPHHAQSSYAPGLSNVPQQTYYGQSPYMPPQSLVFPQPMMQGGVNPVIPTPMSGAVPTTGNPFPAPPMNMNVGGQGATPHMGMGIGMGMPDPVIPGQGQNPEAPVIPPLPSAYGRAGTPYHHPGPSPYDSPDSEEYEDELTPQTRARLQPPLAPGQYGPFDHMRNRRGTPAPALRRTGHRRAESSPEYRQEQSLPYGMNPEAPVIPPPGMINGYPQPQFTTQQTGPIYPPSEPPRREPSPVYRHRRWSPLRMNHNPLPPPPKDISLDSPYVRLLHELQKPIDEAAIKARIAEMPAIHTVGAIPIPGAPHGSRSSREKKRKGLFRSLSSRLQSRRPEDGSEGVGSPGSIPPVTFIGGHSTPIYPIVQRNPDGSTSLIYNPPAPQATQPAGLMSVPGGQAASTVPPVIPGFVPGAAQAHSTSPGFVPAATQAQAHMQGLPGHPPIYAPSPGPMRMPSPPYPAPAPPSLRIERTGEFAGLVHTSPHKVHYNHKSYPTALHLIEALKFLPDRPEFAEQVRRCGTPEEAIAIASSLRDHWRSDWELTLESYIDDALYAKFIQHPRLRNLLLSTGNMPLLYAEPSDRFWGEGPMGNGLNHLGSSLMRVRDRLRAEGVDS